MASLHRPVTPAPIYLLRRDFPFFEFQFCEFQICEGKAMQGKKSSISKEEVLSTLQRVATELGRTPTREELEQMSGISPAVVRKHFTKHRAAVRAAGVEAGPPGAGGGSPKGKPLGGRGRGARGGKGAPTPTQEPRAGKNSYTCVSGR